MTWAEDDHVVEGAIIRIRPDGDDWDDLICRVTATESNEATLIVFVGPKKGVDVGQFCFEDCLRVSPLELLAMEAE